MSKRTASRQSARQESRSGQEPETQSTSMPGTAWDTFYPWSRSSLGAILSRSRVIIFSFEKRETRLPQESAGEGLGWHTGRGLCGSEVCATARAACNPGLWDSRLPGTVRVGRRSHQATHVWQLPAPGSIFPDSSLNRYAPKNSASKHLRQRLTTSRIKERDKSVITVEDLTHHSY